MTVHSAARDVREKKDIESCMMAERLKTAKSAVVSIRAFAIEEGEVWSRVGSGWIYNSEGLIITRQSVVQGSDSIEVQFFNGRREPASVLDCDPVSQVAVLKTGYSAVSSLKTGKACSLKKNECVILLGNSLGVFPSVTLGHLLEFQDQRHFIFAGSVPPGNSGGPIFNRKSLWVWPFLLKLSIPC
jgi:S1-C subfamily serine protease